MQVKPFLVRASSEAIEAGLKDAVMKVVKKGMLALVGIGLFSGLAQGKDFNKSQFEKAAKQFNQTAEQNGIDIKMTASMTGEEGGPKQMVLNYKSSDGSSASVIYLKSAHSMEWLDLKAAKGSDGIIDPIVEDTAKEMFKSIKKAMEDEGIELNLKK